MRYQISYSSVLHSRWDQTSIFSGSSKHRLVDGVLLTKGKNPISLTKKKRQKRTNATKEKPKERKKRSYKLNKSKVRKKCNAFSRLEKSKKFFAFYSISFPCGLSDDTGYKIFNTWLTRCRKDCGLKSYLWVAERQINGTIHFHLLTNDYMQIKRVNSYMRACLAFEQKNGLDILKSVKIKKYNGVDVKKVNKNNKSLIGYLTKYITKNEVEFYHLPWHCSRDVSRLFTTIHFDEPDDDKYFNKLPRIESIERKEEKYRFTKTKNYHVAGFKFKPLDSIYTELDSLNEYIYTIDNK